MTITPTSLAAANAVGAQNVKFEVSAENVPRKAAIVGLYDETTKTTIVQESLYLVSSAEEVGDVFGFGFQVHRLAQKFYQVNPGLPLYIIPVDQDAASSAEAIVQTIVCTSSSAGTFHLFISGDYVPVSIAKGLDETEIALLVKAAVDADTDLPVTAAVLAGVITFTSKDESLQANDIIVSLNEILGQELPGGITSAAIVPGVAGTGVMADDMQSALETALGTGDAANTVHITDFIHGFGDTSAVLDDISEYVGEGDTFTGLWAKTLQPPRPFRSMCGDTVAGSSGLTAVLALGLARKELDRTNGQISVPGSPNHPNEIAALAMGVMAKGNNVFPAGHFVDADLPGILPGALEDQWTSEYTDRDTAVKAGISPTIVVAGAVKMQNTVTFYHPAAVSVASNGYRSMVSISKLQNILYAWWLTFQQAKWQGQAGVEDISKVTDITARRNTKDTNSLLGDITALTIAMAGKSWLYSQDFTLNKLQSERATRIAWRVAGTGWDVLYPIILSSEPNLINTTVEFDTDIAAAG